MRHFHSVASDLQQFDLDANFRERMEVLCCFLAADAFIEKQAEAVSPF